MLWDSVVMATGVKIVFITYKQHRLSVGIGGQAFMYPIEPDRRHNI